MGKKADIEYPFEHGEVINYTFDGASIHRATTKLQASFLVQYIFHQTLGDEFNFQQDNNLKH